MAPHGIHRWSRWLRPCTVIALLLVMTIIACDEDEPVTIPVEQTAEELTATGWTSFEDGEMDAASTMFSLALEKDPDHVDAYLGLGWSRLSLATTMEQLQVSLQSLAEALNRSPRSAAVHAGRAVVLLALGGDSLSAAIAASAMARQISPEFVFIHRTSFDIDDLHLIDAFAHTARGDLAVAIQSADAIEPSGIQEGAPDSWRVEGVLQRSFEDAVLAYLQRLSDSISG